MAASAYLPTSSLFSSILMHLPHPSRLALTSSRQNLLAALKQ